MEPIWNPPKKRKFVEDLHSSFESTTAEYKTKDKELRGTISQTEQSRASEKAATEEKLLDMKYVENVAVPDNEESQMTSTEKDDAYSDGEESTDSDHEFEMMKLFAWLDKKEWARRYYDSEDGVVIHVQPGKVESSKHLLDEEFPHFHKYSVVETEPGVCRYCADPGEEDKEKSEETNINKTPNAQNPGQTNSTQITEAHSPVIQIDAQTTEAQSVKEKIYSEISGAQCQENAEFSRNQNPKTPANQSVLLQPGFMITSDERIARFSGRVGSKGLTVAHIGPSNNIHHYCNNKQHLIGTMEKIFEVDVSYTHQGQTINVRTTADLGLLDLEPYCIVQNIIFDRYNGNFRLKLYKEHFKIGIPVLIIDRNGDEKHGKLTSEHFTLKRNKPLDSSLAMGDEGNREVYNMLQIQNEISAISDEGDSGALVTSIPVEGSDELFVYGIVTHLFKREQLSATIANRLSDILHSIDISGRSVGLRDPRSNNIDFTENVI